MRVSEVCSVPNYRTVLIYKTNPCFDNLERTFKSTIRKWKANGRTAKLPRQDCLHKLTRRARITLIREAIPFGNLWAVMKIGIHRRSTSNRIKLDLFYKEEYVKSLDVQSRYIHACQHNCISKCLQIWLDKLLTRGYGGYLCIQEIAVIVLFSSE